MLDNCLRLLDAAADLANGILGLTVDSKVFATSRELLGVPGETCRRLDGRAAGDRAHSRTDTAGLGPPPEPSRVTYQPRATHSSRLGRSAPMVVGSPWPGCTDTWSALVKSRSRIESMMVSNDE